MLFISSIGFGSQQKFLIEKKRKHSMSLLSVKWGKLDDNGENTCKVSCPRKWMEMMPGGGLTTFFLKLITDIWNY